jgi:phosphoserine phosphatase RsbU/P
MKLRSTSAGVKTRPRPSAEHAAMSVAILWLLLPCVLAATSGLIVISLFIVAPLIVATAADERRTALIAGATVVLTIAAGWWHGPIEDPNWIRLTAVCAMSLLAVVLAGVRRQLEERLARMTAIAKASQVALLPPVPPQITGISIAARYRSGTPEASVGGDLYEIIPTGHGIRVIIGDVRGNGLDAILLARQVLSAFRRSAVAVPALEHVASEVSRAIRPNLGEEDFVTAVLAQIAPSGELTVVNCGHHPPLVHHGGGLRPLTGTTALPLGLEEHFTAFTASWLPGDRLLLYTDGLVESRNHRPARRRRRPGGAPGRYAFPAAAPTPACLPCRLGSAVSIPIGAQQAGHGARMVVGGGPAGQRGGLVVRWPGSAAPCSRVG